MVSLPKRQLLWCLWKLIRLPFCLLRQAWIWTHVLTSLMSGAPRLVSEPFRVPLCNWTHLLGLLGERLSPHGSTQPGGIWQGQPSQWALDTEPATRRWKHYPPNPGRSPRNVAGGLRQRLRGHQRFWEVSLLSKLAATQWTQVQKLSPKNKGGFPYIPFRASYRNEGGGYSLSHT
jgi:hypothetical protein